jgi:hypothetical protein
MPDATYSFTAQLWKTVQEANRRSDARYKYNPAAAEQAIQAGGPEVGPIRILNISAGGLAFQSDRRIELGTILSVELPSKDEHGSQWLVLRVTSAEALAPGVWQMGCQFARKLTPSGLLALL